MQAEVVRAKCQHVQEYGERYAALAIIEKDGSKVLLRIPMWQYNDAVTPSLLQRIADAINRE